MKQIILISALVIGVLGTGYSQEMKTADDSISYSAGIIIAKNLKQQGLKDINKDLFIQAVEDILNDRETAMKPSEAEHYFREYQVKMQNMEGEMNKKAGEAFLAENAKRDDVVVLDNGLQYEVLKEGTGAKPARTDKVLTHYHGTLIDGTVFDSSVERGEPIAFRLDQVIEGWTEILQLMPVGSQWRVYIPYDMAYGERGAGSAIGPYSTLIFDIELLEIQ